MRIMLFLLLAIFVTLASCAPAEPAPPEQVMLDNCVPAALSGELMPAPSWALARDALDSRELSALSSDMLWYLNGARLQGKESSMGTAENACAQYVETIAMAASTGDASRCAQLPARAFSVFSCRADDPAVLPDAIEDTYTTARSRCTYSRGGYEQLEGNFSDGTGFSHYYRHGWCSSGGTDCGFDVCFSVMAGPDDPRYAALREEYCAKLSWARSSGDPICDAQGNETYDRTQQVRDECLAGEFDASDGARTTFSVLQKSGRCASEPVQGPLECFRPDNQYPLREMCETAASYGRMLDEDPGACEALAAEAGFEDTDREGFAASCA